MPHSGKNINVRPSRRNDGDPGITEQLLTDRGLGKDVAKQSGEDKNSCALGLWTHRGEKGVCQFGVTHSAVATAGDCVQQGLHTVRRPQRGPEASFADYQKQS
jgi:hypothetical protein